MRQVINLRTLSIPKLEDKKMNNKNQNLIQLIIGVTLLISLGCSGFSVSFNTVEVDDTQNLSHTIEREGAEEVRVDLNMGTGKLMIDSGAGFRTGTLMEGDFIFNVEAWEPEVNYDVRGSEGRLAIRQPQTGAFSFGKDVRYIWDLRFDKEVPMRMDINLGTGDGDIDLGKLNITHLDMKAGTGDVRLDLGGNESLSYVEFDMGTGSLTIDLTGNWQENVDVIINGALGKMTLHLPSDIGVRVDVTQGIGEIVANDMEKRGDTYVNDAYTDAELEDIERPMVQINIRAGIGQINLIVD
jgi:hypothetical protein